MYERFRDTLAVVGARELVRASSTRRYVTGRRRFSPARETFAYAGYKFLSVHFMPQDGAFLACTGPRSGGLRRTGTRPHTLSALGRARARIAPRKRQLVYCAILSGPLDPCPWVIKVLFSAVALSYVAVN